MDIQTIVESSAAWKDVVRKVADHLFHERIAIATPHESKTDLAWQDWFDAESIVRKLIPALTWEATVEMVAYQNYETRNGRNHPVQSQEQMDRDHLDAEQTVGRAVFNSYVYSLPINQRIRFMHRAANI